MIRLIPKDLDFITAWEGFRFTPYDDGYGFQTVGYGHRILPDEKFNFITREEGRTLLEKDIEIAENAVAKLVNIATTHDQYLALVSIVFNAGAERFKKSDTRRVVNTGNIPAIIKRWKTAFITSGGVQSKGLIARRAAEAELWTIGGNTA